MSIPGRVKNTLYIMKEWKHLVQWVVQWLSDNEFGGGEKVVNNLQLKILNTVLTNMIFVIIL